MTTAISSFARTLQRAPMFRDRTNTIATVAFGAGLVYWAFRFLNWAVVNAIWALPQDAGSNLCRVAQREGACWAVIHERFRFILLGSYPFNQQWRPALACLLFISLYAVSALRFCWRPWLPVLWIGVPSAAVLLLRGGFLGLSGVPSEFWGGLPLTFVLSTVGFSAAFPLGVALALGRLSRLPAIRVLCIAYIEVIRGVPIVTFLFMAAVMFPLFMPQSFTVDKLLRAQIAFVMVIAAYLAEVIRAGLQTVPKGQYEASASMGLAFWPTTVLITLPQALRISIPGLVNTFISIFKDTSLVAVIGLFDLLGTAKAVLVDPKWIGFAVEVYFFVAVVYFVFSYAVSQYSQYLERMLAARTHH